MKKVSKNHLRTLKTTVLDSGVKITTSNEDASVSSVSLYVNAGSRFENKLTRGSTHFLKHLGFRGTNNKLALSLVRDVELTGAEYSVDVNREYIAYRLSGLKDTSLDLFTKTLNEVISPKLWEWEVDEVRPAVAHENEAFEADATAVVIDLLHQVAFQSSGLSNSYYSHVDAKRIVPQHIYQHVSENFYPGNKLVISAVGVNHEALVESVTKSGLSTPINQAGVDFELEVYEPLPKLNTPPQKPVFTSGETLVDGSLATTVGLAFPGASIGDPSLYTYSVIRNLLKNRLGDTSVYNVPYTDTGLLLIVGQSDKDYSTSPGANLLKSILKELQHSLTTTQSELDQAKEMTKLDIAKANDQYLTVSEFSALRCLAGIPTTDVNQELASVNSVTLDSVKSVLQKTLSVKPALAIVGDINGIPSL